MGVCRRSLDRSLLFAHVNGPAESKHPMGLEKAVAAFQLVPWEKTAVQRRAKAPDLSELRVKNLKFQIKKKIKNWPVIIHPSHRHVLTK